MFKPFLFATALALGPSAGFAATLFSDLNTWTPEGDGVWAVPGSNTRAGLIADFNNTNGTSFTQADVLAFDASSSAAEQALQGQLLSIGRSATQSRNSNPTVLTSGTNDIGTRITATVEVRDIGDDDFIGFVLGYDEGDLFVTTPDYMLLDWKQRAQVVSSGSDQCTSVSGMFLSQVTGALDNNFFPAFCRNGPVTPVARANAPFDSNGWVAFTEYDFDITYTASRVTVSVNGFEVFDHAGTFPEGSFGLYTTSMEQVHFSDVLITALPPAVPVPASVLLLATGVFGFGAVKRRSARSA